jgi:hypothetical protein
MAPDRILAALLATGWVVQGDAGAAIRLGMHPNTLRYRMQQLGISRPNKVAAPAERHPPSAAVIAEMEQLRTQVRLLLRRPGPRDIQELLRIETRHRYLRALLRAALGEAEGVAGMVRRPCAPGAMRPAWDYCESEHEGQR